MLLHKLKTGIVILIAFVGLLLASGGLAVGLRANVGPETDPRVPEKFPRYRRRSERKMPRPLAR